MDPNNLKVSNLGLWDYIPDTILLHIFHFLNFTQVLNAGLACKNWCRLSYDEILWKQLFCRHYRVDYKNISIAPGKRSWYLEFKRITHSSPQICSEIITEHKNEVLHASFSHDGSLFATCSKDGFVIVWNSIYPVSKKYSYDMKVFSWKYTQFSQFNQSDTLLLVSGVHFGIPTSTSGEIAVFSLQDGFNLQCRVGNKPYDIFGTWFSDRHLLSGDHYWLAHMISTTGLWINKASQETSSEHTPILNQLFRFYNTNASSVRIIMIADCKNQEKHSKNEEQTASLPIIPCKAKENSDRYTDVDDQCLEDSDDEGMFQHISKQSANFGNQAVCITKMSPCSQQFADCLEVCWNIPYDMYHDDLSTLPDKLLIFTSGSKTYTPHNIGFKKIKGIKFPKCINLGLSVKERLANRRERPHNAASSREESNEPDLRKYDELDYIMDLHGHIIGMSLSPDHRFLYVNSRPWPAGYNITNPLDPPPIAQEIDIHVIDLMNFTQVGKVLRSHKAYTPNNECFFIFLDVSEDYVASGAEDKHGYIWDRHYGICIAKLPHTSVVNSVAFNPMNPEMCVSTSDDFEIKVWRSKGFMKNHLCKKKS